MHTKNIFAKVFLAMHSYGEIRVQDLIEVSISVTNPNWLKQIASQLSHTSITQNSP